MSTTSNTPPAASSKAQIWQNVIAIGVLLTILAGMLKGYNVIITDAKAAGSTIAADAGKKADDTAKKLEIHIQESAETHKQMRKDMYEVQQDIRAFYNSQMNGTRSARLEAPPTIRLPDAGL